MARKKKRSSYAVDTLKEDLQEQPVRAAIGPLRSGSYSRYKRILDELSDFPAGDVARELGITVQKYNVITNLVYAKEASTGVLNDLLQNVSDNMQGRRQRIEEDILVYDPEISRRHRVHMETYQEPYAEFIEDNPEARLLKTYIRRAAALKWLAAMPGAEEYFQIVKKGAGKRTRFQIWDIRDPSEQGHRNKRRHQNEEEKSR